MDKMKADAFTNKTIQDISSTYATLLCILGDRLGLFRELDINGQATSSELAKRAGVNERYAREWLSGLTCAGYLEYDSASRRFSLPPEHTPNLTQEGGPVFVAGMYQSLLGEIKILDKLLEVFRKGGGVPLEGYDENEFLGTERMTASWFENLLVQEWIPAVPSLKAKLERGGLVADVGCGRGRALIKLAQVFPNSHFVGYDAFGPAIDAATARGKAAGVSSRVGFRKLDAADGLPEKYDLITTFDVIHDSVHPLRLLQGIRNALRPDGIYLMLEINCSDRLEENIGPVGALMYGWSIMYCMTTSLAYRGDGLGTAGLPESKVRELCTRAGFSTVHRLPLENTFNILYEVRA